MEAGGSQRLRPKRFNYLSFLEHRFPYLTRNLTQIAWMKSEWQGDVPLWI